MENNKPKRGRGRPTHFDQDKADKILTLARRGMTHKQIAETLNISEKSISNWQKKNFDFLLAFHDAKDLADDLAEVATYRRATGYSHAETKLFVINGEIVEKEIIKHYPPDASAAKFWLANRRPDKWSENNAQNPIHVNIENIQEKKQIVVDSIKDLLPNPELLYIEAHSKKDTLE